MCSLPLDAVDFDHYNACALCIAVFFHTEPESQVNYRDYLTPEIYHPFNEIGCLRHRGNPHHADYFFNL